MMTPWAGLHSSASATPASHLWTPSWQLPKPVKREKSSILEVTGNYVGATQFLPTLSFTGTVCVGWSGWETHIKSFPLVIKRSKEWNSVLQKDCLNWGFHDVTSCTLSGGICIHCVSLLVCFFAWIHHWSVGPDVITTIKLWICTQDCLLHSLIISTVYDHTVKQTLDWGVLPFTIQE